MRGLAFPPHAVFDREPSYEHGTPSSNVGDIPIDPALGGPAIDPALMNGGQGLISCQVQQPNGLHQHPDTPQDTYAQVRQYSQGPQGDPFAPQPTVPYFQVETEEPTVMAKPLKRKRRPRREEECGFCQGSNMKNKQGETEVMVTCDECGRSGHPSCMELAEIGDVMRSYPWTCIECKSCEICREKGDDERILFCDFCDRGWHMDCLLPPINVPPTGRWRCPACPEIPLNGPELQPDVPLLSPGPQTPSGRESPVASASRSPSTVLSKVRSGARSKGKGKAPAVPSEMSSESEVDVESRLGEETPRPLRARGRPPKSIKKPRGRPPKVRHVSEDELPAPLARPVKRTRQRMSSPVAPLPRVRLRLSTQNGKGKERKEDESPKGMFDDILLAEERDTSKTIISNMDKQYFERSRRIAEDKLAPPPSNSGVLESQGTPTPGPSSRPLRSSTLQHVSTPFPPGTPIGHSASPGPSTPAPFLTDPVALRIRTIRFGHYDIDTWYDAPFPEEYATIPDGRLWICEFCLKYMKSRFGAVRHRMKCKARHPPGDEIYRDLSVSIFEVDGRKNKIYCQNLCLLSKMFLDHKSLFYDVEPFLFYVITEVDDFGARFVGYFSKEKRSPKDYNVSCIMTLPVRQRQGWGNLLIDFSYLLSKKEQRLGSPEKPLSSLGALGYKNYWTLAVMRYLESAPEKPKLEDICEATSMTAEDVFTTLLQQHMVTFREPTPPMPRPSPGQSIKFPKGRKNGISRRHLHRVQTKEKDLEAVKGPFVMPKHYEIRWDHTRVEKYMRTWEAKGYLKLKPEKLQWSPYLLTRTKEEAQPSGSESPAPKDIIPVHGKSYDPLHRVDSQGVPRGAQGATYPRTKLTKQADAGQLPEVLVDNFPRQTLRSQSSQLSTATSLQGASLSLGISNSPSRRTRTRSGPEVKTSLASALISEEHSQTPSLRSGHGSGSLLEHIHTATSPAPSIRSHPRKRRRVDSSPEPEFASQCLPTIPVNGVKVVRPSSPTLDSQGILQPDAANLPLKTRTPTPLHQRPNTPPVIPPEPFSLGPSAGHPRPDRESDDDPEVKSEDLGTPLTSLTSRQSLPSEDTVYAADSTAAHKGLTIVDRQPAPQVPPARGRGGAVEEIDIDADGEYEEDDADGDVDIDMENCK